MEKRQICLLTIVILLIIFFAIPVYITLFTKSLEEEYITYKELQEKYSNDEYKTGDVVYVRDTLSGIWYNESVNYTFMTFKSNDNYRTAPWGYDAGFPKNITGEIKLADEVEVKFEFRPGENNGKKIQGYMLWIRLPGEENIERE